jgi:hypothetical protein
MAKNPSEERNKLLQAKSYRLEISKMLRGFFFRMHCGRSCLAETKKGRTRRPFIKSHRLLLKLN